MHALSSTDQTTSTLNFANQLLLQYLPASNSKRVVKENKTSSVSDGQMIHYTFDRQETFMGDKFTI